jgi:hypothetical protein
MAAIGFGISNAFDIFNSSGTTDAIVDVSGWYASAEV